MIFRLGEALKLSSGELRVFDFALPTQATSTGGGMTPEYLRMTAFPVSAPVVTLSGLHQKRSHCWQRSELQEQAESDSGIVFGLKKQPNDLYLLADQLKY